MGSENRSEVGSILKVVAPAVLSGVDVELECGAEQEVAQNSHSTMAKA